MTLSITFKFVNSSNIPIMGKFKIPVGIYFLKSYPINNN